MSERNYWLMKSEPDVYGIDHLMNEPDQITHWDGIRNYAARNYMRDGMKVGDGVFFYHSMVKVPSIVGTMEVVKEAYTDHTQFDPNEKYFDPKSPKSNPRWIMVDVKFRNKWENPVTRNELKKHDWHKEMVLFKISRLSVGPITEEQWQLIHELAGQTPW